MEATEMSENISTLFDSAKYSDVTIKFSGNEIKADKVILAQGSEFFRACFDGGFKESGAPVVELKDDDPNAVKGFIAHLYGLSFDGRDTFTKFQTYAPVEDASGVDFMKYQVNLFLVGKKYLTSSLSRKVTIAFSSRLRQLNLTDRYPDVADQIARHVYLAHEDEATELHEPIVTFFRQRMEDGSSFQADARFRQLLIDAPELSADLVQALAPCDTSSVSEPQELAYASKPSLIGRPPKRTADQKLMVRNMSREDELELDATNKRRALRVRIYETRWEAMKDI